MNSLCMNSLWIRYVIKTARSVLEKWNVRCTLCHALNTRALHARNETHPQYYTVLPVYVIGKHPKLLISDNFHRVTSVIAFCVQEPLECCSMSGNLQRNKTTRSITTLQSLLSFLFCDCDWSYCWMVPSQGESGKLHYMKAHVQLGQGSCNFLQWIFFI